MFCFAYYKCFEEQVIVEYTPSMRCAPIKEKFRYPPTHTDYKLICHKKEKLEKKKNNFPILFYSFSKGLRKLITYKLSSPQKKCVFSLINFYRVLKTQFNM